QGINVDGGQDHRLHPAEQVQRYWVKDPEALERTFRRLSQGIDSNYELIELNHQLVRFRYYCASVVWFDFDELCERPLAALDFIDLCDRFPAVLLGEVKRLSATARAVRIARGTEDAVEQVQAGARLLPPLAKQDDSVRRLIGLVQECYGRGVPPYIEAEVPLHQPYTQGGLTF